MEETNGNLDRAAHSVEQDATGSAYEPVFERYEPGMENRLDYTPHARAITPFLRFIEALERVFRYEVSGFERLLAPGPAVVVANHGQLPFEMFFLGARYFRATGRVFRGITDPRVFKAPLIRDLWATLGIVDGTPENAVALLERGEKIVIMPGGSREAFKPTRLRYRLRWEGRTGFIRVAVQGRAPIIPVTCVGVDHHYFVANDAYRLERFFREWIGSKLIPLPVFVGIGALPFPAKLSQTVGEPIVLDEPLSTLTDERRLDQIHARIVATVQKMLDDALVSYDPFAR